MEERHKQLLVLAREHFDRGELDRAEHALSQVLERADDFADVHHLMGLVLHGRGQFLRARRHFERAVEINGSYTEALLSLAICLNDLGDYDAARVVHERIRDVTRVSGDTRVRDPFALGKIANLHADLATAYAHAGYLEEAAAELEKAVALRPTFVDLWLRLGGYRRELGRLDGARDALESACAQNPAFVQARVQLGVVLSMLGEHDLAIVQLEEAVRLDPANKTAPMYLRMAREAGTR